MDYNKLLNTRHLPKTNRQIKRASVKLIVKTIAFHYLFSDIQKMGRDFDSLWENGRSEEISREFSKLYLSMPELQTACNSSRYFSKTMIRDV